MSVSTSQLYIPGNSLTDQKKPGILSENIYKEGTFFKTVFLEESEWGPVSMVCALSYKRSAILGCERVGYNF